MDIAAKAVRGETGEIEFILFNKKDVTQRKVLREAKFLKTKFGDLLESTPDAIVMANVTGRIVLANSQAEKVFGYEPDELRGRTVEELIPSRFHGSHVRHRGGYLGQPRTRPMGAGLELYGLRKNGSEFPVEISLSPLRTDEGTFVMSAIRDISERKQFERELQAKNTALEAANQELESFSYSISHDLRAPLRAMGGFARILSKQLGANLSPDAALALDRIRENALRMGQLVDGLLAFSSLSRQPLAKQRVEPAAIVQRVLDELRPEFAGRAIEVNVAALPPCEADPTLLQQVFANLISNAVKYTRGRNPAVITIGARIENGRPAYFVQDNGAGFEMEYAAKLFRVFQRLHTSEEFEGTGVGLAIVQRIVQRHGGRVWAEGAEQRGATFHFTLNESNGARA